MNKIFDKLSAFGFHDTVISSMTVMNNGISIVFDDGLFALDDNGKETSKTQKVKLLISINMFNKNKLFEHIDICYHKKHKVFDMSLEQSDAIKKCDDLMIDNIYFSNFNNSLLIKSFGGKYRGTEISIEDIKDIEFIF